MNPTVSEQSPEQSAGQPFLSRQKGLLTRLVLLSVLVLLTGQIAVSWFALVGFEKELSPQLSQKANAVGYAISAELAYATTELNIPPEQLVGVDKYFNNYLEQNKDIEYLALLDSTGDILFVEGVAPGLMRTILSELPENVSEESNFQVDVEGYLDGRFQVSDAVLGGTALHVGVTSEHLRSQFFEMIFEILTVIAISWLVTFEFLVFYMRTRVSRPMDHIRTVLTDGARGVFANRLVERSKDEIGQLILSFNRLVQDLHIRYNDFVFEVIELKQAQIDNAIATKIAQVRSQFDRQFVLTGGKHVSTRSVTQIRVPLFLFIFSEELSRSFIPLFVSKYAPTDAAISHDVLVGLPITLFMLAVMVVTPFGGGLVDRFGVRRVFLIGVVAAVLGFLGNFLTQTYFDLILFRVLTGIGYSLIFVASEGWVVQNAEEHNRTASTGVFVIAVFVGIVCGPPIGGMLANRIGYEATFLISAALAFLSGYIVYQVFRSGSEENETAKRTRIILSRGDLLTLIKDARFTAILLFAAIPGKMMLAGFIAYLVPLYLTELGHNQSSVGRLMMLYGLATISCIFLSARYADRSRKFVLVIFCGGILAGLGCVSSMFVGSIGVSATGGVVIAILGLGFGHALTLTSQNAMILQIADHHSGKMGRASVVSTYRLFERLGMVIGPLVAVALVNAFGYGGAIAAFGFILLGLILLFLITMMSASDSKSMQTGIKATGA